MGNYIILFFMDKETKFKNDGTQYIEFVSLKGKKVTDVFKIMQKLYPEYKIISVDKEVEKSFLKIEKGMINIYFNKATQNVIRVEVFH